MDTDLIQTLHSRAFNAAKYYDGPLGIHYTPEETTFRLWAPTARRVQLILVSPNRQILEMKRLPEAPMVFGLSIRGNLWGRAYRYLLTFADGSSNESCDPYAVASTVNSGASVILDPGQIAPEGWTEDRLPGHVDPLAASIYEVHIRDLTIAEDNGIRHKGQYLGLCEENTFTSRGARSGLAYLRSLGVSHIEFQPLFDFGGVDEAGDLSFDAQYNWGYNPVNYNVPEGSYASDPSDPACRIRELKAMILALHRQGLRVILDVVFNHVYEVENNSLALTVPGYYFRYDQSGNLYNSTFVGNETASEQRMFRRYMIDSLCYWARQYNVDGFRFDLMGIHDVQTMREIRQALDAIDPNILMVGEGWVIGQQPADVTPSDDRHCQEMPGIAFFNDELRDILRGDTFHAESPGFLHGNGSPELSQQLYANMIARPCSRQYLDASQSLVYVSAHDNHTLADKLLLGLPNSSLFERLRRQILAHVLLSFTSGVHFYHAGVELLRGKARRGDTYNGPDHLNLLPYDNQLDFPESFQIFSDLLRLRQNSPALQLGNLDQVAASRHLLAAEPGRLALQVSDGNMSWVVYVNARNDAWDVRLTPSRRREWFLNGLQRLNGPLEGDQLQIAGVTAVIFREWEE